MVRQYGPILAWSISDALLLRLKVPPVGLSSAASSSAVQSEQADVVASMRHSQLQSLKDSPGVIQYALPSAERV